jgi:hypothetical protein
MAPGRVWRGFRQADCFEGWLALEWVEQGGQETRIFIEGFRSRVLTTIVGSALQGESKLSAVEQVVSLRYR